MKVPLRIRVEELATAYGNNYKHVTFDNTTIRDIVQKFAVKSDGGKYGYEDISELSPVEKQDKWEDEYLK
ncbi:hypothetical protein ACFQ9Y_19930 [Peribacillus simplex]|uniref:hypothetical protein n=1 Tax=Peribacillus simplex TaxID=1478 RepID=UPI00366B1CA0